MEYAFCETPMATPTSPVHIRLVGEQGRKLSGGAEDTVLCERPLMRGWDLQGDVTPESVRRTSASTVVHGRTCSTCATIYLEMTR